MFEVTDIALIPVYGKYRTIRVNSQVCEIKIVNYSSTVIIRSDIFRKTDTYKKNHYENY